MLVFIRNHLADLHNWAGPGTARSAWMLWCVFAVVMGLLATRSTTQTVTDNYRFAAQSWLDSASMYKTGADGWLYPPQGALLFVPFQLLPTKVGECLWRIACVMLLAWSVRSATRAFAGAWLDRRPLAWADGFFICSLLVIPASLGSALNGQTNLPLGACIALACAAVVQQRWWACAAWCVLGLMCKPLMMVPMLLIAALWLRRIWPAMLGAVVVFAALPLLHTDWAYAMEQYRLGISKVMEAGSFRERAFADMVGMLGQWGVVVPATPAAESAMTLLRGLTAMLVLLVCYFALVTRRSEQGLPMSTANPLGPTGPIRPLGLMGVLAQLAPSRVLAVLRDPPNARDGALCVMALSACYLMLMNPRTEGVSYCIAALPVALMATLAIIASRRAIAAALMGVIVVYAAAHEIARPITGQSNDLLLRPLVTLFVAGMVVWFVLARVRVREALKA